MILRSFLLILCILSVPGWASHDRLDMAGLIKLLLAQGYHDIREVELEGRSFEVKTLNRHNQVVYLSVDAHSGEITEKKAAR